MGDVVGRLFHEFAITLSVTIVISAVVSLTLVPMMCARLVTAPAGGAAQPVRPSPQERGFNLDDRGHYDRALTVVLEHQPLTSVHRSDHHGGHGRGFMSWFRSGFFPVQDTGLIQGISVAAQTTSFERHGAAPARPRGGSAERSGCGQLEFVHRRGWQQHDAEQWTPADQPEAKGRPLAENATAIRKRRLQQETAEVPGVSLYLQPVQDLTIDAAISRTQYQFVLENPNLSAVQRVGCRNCSTN